MDLKCKSRHIIIAGAPRCGTTSLFNYLNDHPNIFGLDVKETCYFLDEGYFNNASNQTKLLPNYHKYGMKGYGEIFKEAQDGQILLDATPDYLYQKTFLKVLPTFDTKPFIIFCLREPASRIFSLFKFAKSRLGILDNDTTFEEFLEAIEEDDYSIKTHNILKYSIEHSKYVNYIDQITKIVGIENIYIIINEQFIQSPNEILVSIANKCGINSSLYENYEFKKHNESYEVKTQIFRKLYEKLPLPYSVRYGDNKIKSLLKRIHHKFNTNENQSKTSNELKLLDKLSIRFKPYNDLLESKYKVDLSKWKKSINPKILQENS